MPRLNKYMQRTPTPRQQLAMCRVVDRYREVLYGGAAGGGKSEWLLMSALQYVDVPGYAALLVRRTHPMLALPGGLIQRAHEMLDGTDAVWSGSKSRWTFPSGAIMQFGHLQHEQDKTQYQSSEFTFIGFDELTHFTETQYRYLFSRLRRLSNSKVPLRMRVASNPGGVGHDWVNQRFRVEDGDSRLFISAKLKDNPYLDAKEYTESLMQLHPHERSQLLDGDWDSKPPGALLERGWFKPVNSAPNKPGLRRIRYWDLAATAKKRNNADPDWTSGALMTVDDGKYTIEHIRRFRKEAGEVEAEVVSQAHVDGAGVEIVIEQEPGSSGKFVIASFVKALAGFIVRGDRVTGSKSQRCSPFASQAQAGNVNIVMGQWTNDFLDEAEIFSGDGSTHDDQVDSVSGAFGQLHDAQSTWGDFYGRRNEAA